MGCEDTDYSLNLVMTSTFIVWGYSMLMGSPNYWRHIGLSFVYFTN